MRTWRGRHQPGPLPPRAHRHATTASSHQTHGCVSWSGRRCAAASRAGRQGRLRQCWFRRGPPRHDLGFDADPGFDADQTPTYDLTEPEPVPDFFFDQSAGA